MVSVEYATHESTVDGEGCLLRIGLDGSKGLKYAFLWYNQIVKQELFAFIILKPKIFYNVAVVTTPDSGEIESEKAVGRLSDISTLSAESFDWNVIEIDITPQW